jgi:hypothetical protein
VGVLLPSRTVWVLLCLFLPSLAFAQASTPDPWMRAGYVSLAAVSFADVDSTARALERGLVEKNPLYKPFTDKPAVLGLVNGAISGAVGLGAYSLHKRGHRKEARVIVWTWTAIKAAVVIWNVKQLKGTPCVRCS